MGVCGGGGGDGMETPITRFLGHTSGCAPSGGAATRIPGWQVLAPGLESDCIALQHTSRTLQRSDVAPDGSSWAGMEWRPVSRFWALRCEVGVRRLQGARRHARSTSHAHVHVRGMQVRSKIVSLVYTCGHRPLAKTAGCLVHHGESCDLLGTCDVVCVFAIKLMRG